MSIYVIIILKITRIYEKIEPTIIFGNMNVLSRCSMDDAPMSTNVASMVSRSTGIYEVLNGHSDI